MEGFSNIVSTGTDEERRMNILITNDDGIHAMGIIALARRLREEHNVCVVAPEVERSGCGHSITLKKPLYVTRNRRPEYDGIRAYSINGTPADCVMLGLSEIAGEKTDLVVSGINLGANIGTNVAYSGTVNAALEGCICGYPSIALSQAVERPARPEIFPVYFETAADIAAQIIGQLDLESLDDHILNINFPAAVREARGVMVCEQGVNTYDTKFKRDADPMGREIFWIMAEKNEEYYNEKHKTDAKWTKEGYITVTPLTWNDTCHPAMRSVECKMEKMKLRF
jgi:5'-nucleotidase